MTEATENPKLNIEVCAEISKGYYPDWKYINVRRLFIFVEESIEEGTQWVVFEPNDEPTWVRVKKPDIRIS